MAESIVRWFIVREKYCSLAKKVRLIRQTNRAMIQSTPPPGRRSYQRAVTAMLPKNLITCTPEQVSQMRTMILAAHSPNLSARRGLGQEKLKEQLNRRTMVQCPVSCTRSWRQALILISAEGRWWSVHQ
jgi:hypothetical protein